MVTTLSGIPINPDECIGDSLIAINESFAELDRRTIYLLSAVALSAIDTDTIDLERNSTTNTLSANVKDASITNKKIAFDGGSFCFRNKLINGSMVVNQRTPGMFLSVPLNNATTQKNYFVDRWSCECAPQPAAGFADFVAFQSDDAPTGFTNSFAVSVVADQTFNAPLISTTTRATISQTIETRDIVDFKFGTTSAMPLTLSFWAKGSNTGNYTGQIKSHTNTGSVKSFLFSFNLSSVDWEQKTIHIVGDQDPAVKITNTHFLTASNNAGMSVEFNLGCGNDYGITSATLPSTWVNGDYITLKSFVGAIANISQMIQMRNSILKITGVQLELGPTATPFEYRPLTIETTLCERYFEKSYPLERFPSSILLPPMNITDGVTINKVALFEYETLFNTEKRTIPIHQTYNPQDGTNTIFIRDAVNPLNTTSRPSLLNSYPKTSTKQLSLGVDVTTPVPYTSYYGLLHWVADSEIY